MRIASALSAGQFRRRPLVVFGILVLGAFAAHETPQHVIDDGMADLARAAMRIVRGVAVLAILNDRRNGEPARPGIR
jgi:hypothetical protein